MFNDQNLLCCFKIIIIIHTVIRLHIYHRLPKHYVHVHVYENFTWHTSESDPKLTAANMFIVTVPLLLAV